MDNDGFRRWIVDQKARTDAVGALATRAILGDVWRLDTSNSTLSSVDRATLNTALAEYRAQGQRSPKRARRSTVRTGRLSKAPIKVMSGSCQGCGKSAAEGGRRTLRVRGPGGGVTIWHGECRDDARFGADRPARQVGRPARQITRLTAAERITAGW